MRSFTQSRQKVADTLMIEERLLSQYVSGFNRKLKAIIIGCKNTSVYKRLAHLKGMKMHGIFILDVRVMDPLDESSLFCLPGIYLNFSTLNYGDNLSILSLSKTGNSSAKILNQLSLSTSIASYYEKPVGIPTDIDRSSYVVYALNNAESLSTEITEYAQSVLSYYDYIWYQSGAHCQMIADSYKLQYSCKDLMCN